MPPSIFFKALRDSRWQVFWYGAGLASLAAVVIVIYPSYRAQLQNFELPEAFKAFFGGVGEYGSPQGFVSAEFFSSWIPALLAIFAIMQGTSALAGEEANGTMELLLAQPVSRRRLVLEKLAAFVVSTGAILGLTCIGWVLSIPFVDIDLSLGRTLLATFNLAPIVLAFGALSAWAGAAFPDRRLATGFVAMIAVVSYVVDALAQLVDILSPLRWTSAFHYYAGTTVIRDGLDWPKMAVLLGAFFLFSALTLKAFERRDIHVRAGAYSLRSLFRRTPNPQAPAEASSLPRLPA